MVKKETPAETPPTRREEVIPMVCARRIEKGVSVGILMDCGIEAEG
jgi:hypothetical protein